MIVWSFFDLIAFPNRSWFSFPCEKASILFPLSNVNIANLSFQAVKQEEEMSQQTLELAEARKNYTIESEKVSSFILEKIQL